ncbi:hypothetical protein CYMTET_32877 [Cymbomonas tetramitiformis]|uniref:Uncharacterized protein n=1 Tax=Cymbomonas tetramitiformis TaxID=36881 RepID=A0AAE0KRH9_9CHLO|nr:hypothetical protein CYMTET_32877 [Cymbomonas tetramitiformis]
MGANWAGEYAVLARRCWTETGKHVRACMGGIIVRDTTSLTLHVWPPLDTVLTVFVQETPSKYVDHILLNNDCPAPNMRVGKLRQFSAALRHFRDEKQGFITRGRYLAFEDKVV